MLRKGYVTPCRFFHDSDIEIPIRWYRCLPGAPVLGTESAISPLGWRKFPWTHTGVGEVFGAEWKYRAGIPIPAATGNHVCGTDGDFNNGAHYDPTLPPTIYRPDGLPLCCAPLPGGIVLGGSSPAFSLAGGIDLGGAAYVIHKPLVPSDGGLEMGGTGYYPPSLSQYLVQCFDPSGMWAPYTMVPLVAANTWTDASGGGLTLTTTTRRGVPGDWTLTLASPPNVWSLSGWDGLSPSGYVLFNHVSGSYPGPFGVIVN